MNVLITIGLICQWNIKGATQTNTILFYTHIGESQQETFRYFFLNNLYCSRIYTELSQPKAS